MEVVKGSPVNRGVQPEGTVLKPMMLGPRGGLGIARCDAGVGMQNRSLQMMQL